MVRGAGAAVPGRKSELGTILIATVLGLVAVGGFGALFFMKGAAPKPKARDQATFAR